MLIEVYIRWRWSSEMERKPGNIVGYISILGNNYPGLKIYIDHLGLLFLRHRQHIY